MARKTSLASQLFSDSVVPLGIGLGIILIWIASLVATLATGAEVSKVVNILKNTGVTLVSMMMIGGGITIAEKERSVRIAMVIMGAIVLLYLIPSTVPGLL